MQVRELVKALDLIGQVYSSDGENLSDAITILKAQFAGCDQNLNLKDWVALRKNPRGSKAWDLQTILSELEHAADDSSTFSAFQKLETIRLDANNWKKLAKLATGNTSCSGKAARDALRGHLANQVQLHNRRSTIARLFP